MFCPSTPSSRSSPRLSSAPGSGEPPQASAAQRASESPPSVRLSPNTIRPAQRGNDARTEHLILHARAAHPAISLLVRSSTVSASHCQCSLAIPAGSRERLCRTGSLGLSTAVSCNTAQRPAEA
ncbi:hypothetical protein K466DRAFT_300486 [Polyporus arcularius HHB13444]|uniref:Uncharacterized protein n=1 Tax=Polyporus arcularius HHB13444 TaxID=1314778 RepID=A0A5C3PR89_9APHY|nr:hypothetical protein K466DRAFT_300486 [Polyporus arcularius HHB13444]